MDLTASNFRRRAGRPIRLARTSVTWSAPKASGCRRCGSKGWRGGKTPRCAWHMCAQGTRRQKPAIVGWLPLSGCRYATGTPNASDPVRVEKSTAFPA